MLLIRTTLKLLSKFHKPITLYITMTLQPLLLIFHLHQLYITSSDISQQTSPLSNVQSTSHTSKTRNLPSLPCTPENLMFIHKFNVQFSDLTDTEIVTFCNMLLKYKTCYATHKNIVGKISTFCRIKHPIRCLLKYKTRYATHKNYVGKITTFLSE